MAFDTVLANKLRSALTILGVVIGITSIVGMTSLVRGSTSPLRELIAEAGPNLIYVERYGASSSSTDSSCRSSCGGRTSRSRCARARAAGVTCSNVDIEFGAAPVGPVTNRRVYYRDLKSKNSSSSAPARIFAEGTRLRMLAGALLQRYRSATTAPMWSCSGTARISCCSARAASIRLESWCASAPSGRGRRRVRQAPGAWRRQPHARRLRCRSVHLYQRAFGLRIGRPSKTAP